MSDLYDTDFHEWAETQAGLLRNRYPNALDWDNLAEEIEELARRERREIRNRLAVLCAQLLKWEFQPRLRSNSWRGPIRETRRQIADLIEENPTLAPYRATKLDEAYGRGREDAEAEISLADLPGGVPLDAGTGARSRVLARPAVGGRRAVSTVGHWERDRGACHDKA
jgi:hypothetical protein